MVNCKHLVEAATLGAIISPPIPAFYNRPASLDDIIDHSVARVLDLFDIDAICDELADLYRARCEFLGVAA